MAGINTLSFPHLFITITTTRFCVTAIANLSNFKTTKSIHHSPSTPFAFIYTKYSNNVCYNNSLSVTTVF